MLQTLRPVSDARVSGLKHGMAFSRRLGLAVALTAWGTAAAAQDPQEAPAGEATIVSHGVSTFGELKYSADFPHFDYVNPEAPKGGTMSFRGVGASQTFDSLNAFILKGEPAQGLGLLYDSLLVGAGDEPDAAYGLIAESIEYPEDRSWVIFTLRPEARFSDGHPITAEDVVFTLNILKEQGAPAYRISLRDLASAEALDERRVRFNFAEGLPRAARKDLPALAGGLSILPKHYYETVAFDQSTLEPPVGSGQYVVADVQPGRSIRYCRNPDYWGAKLPVNVGTNNFDCYIYEYFADNTAAFEALKVGAYLFHQEFFSSLWATAYDFPAVRNGWVIKETLPDNRPAGTQGFWFNLRRAKFQDPRVREAIGLMFNFEWTNATLFHNLYKRTDSFWENAETLQATGVPEGLELAALEEFRDWPPPGIFTDPAWVPPVMGPQQLDRSAIRQASRLLDEAGWTVGADGLRRNAAGETLAVEYLDDNPSFERVINPFIANLRRLGVDASYRQVDAAQMQQRQENFDYDITGGRFNMSLSPGLELRQFFTSESASAPGTVNLSGIADPVVDTMVERIIEAEDRETMEARVRALDRVLRSKHIWVPNWYSGEYLIAYWDVFGRPDKQPPYSRGDETWWFDQARYDRLKAEGALR